MTEEKQYDKMNPELEPLLMMLSDHAKNVEDGAIYNLSTPEAALLIKVMADVQISLKALLEINEICKRTLG